MAVGKKYGGRKKGTPNKLTRSVKLALDDAFTKMGGVAALVRWGAENPTEFYKLWAKILPVEAREADAALEQELKRLQAEVLRRQLDPPTEDKDGGPGQEYTLTPDEDAPKNPIL